MMAFDAPSVDAMLLGQVGWVVFLSINRVEWKVKLSEPLFQRLFPFCRLLLVAVWNKTSVVRRPVTE
jgi:hypothetical protein